MTYKNNEFFGVKINPVDLLATVFAETMMNEPDSAKSKFHDFDVKSHLDNLATMGQGLFENLAGAASPSPKNTVVEFTPAVDVLESETQVRYIVGIPGVSQDDVSVELEDAKLTISVNSENIFLASEPTRNWQGGSWTQSFNIPNGTPVAPKKIDEENISATVANGLITVLVSYKAPVVTKIKVV